VKELAGQIDLEDLMEQLGKQKIDSILLEGGGTLNWSALEKGIVNAVQAYIAPKLFGGKDAKSPVEGRGVALPAEAVQLTNTRITKLGEDFLLEGEIKA
jgi:diaminohydroxyphosphoribosylaminopyrimidine deaminase/5-amino-6-(5-phosphoribosylamino)uracil reductase